MQNEVWALEVWALCSSKGPCCPASVNVSQVTQAMTNVTWSPGSGARSFITTLTSSRGHAKCHTLDTHCLMGCITCGTRYNIDLEAISSSGHRSECRYDGFSSSEGKFTHNRINKMHAYLRVWEYFGNLTVCDIEPVSTWAHRLKKAQRKTFNISLLQVPAVQQTWSSTVWPTTPWGCTGALWALRSIITRWICSEQGPTTPAAQPPASDTVTSRRKRVGKSTK